MMRPMNVRMKQFSWIYLNLLKFALIYLNLLEFIWIYLNSSVWKKHLTDGPTDQQTDGRTDGRTDKASYRDAWTHLKMSTHVQNIKNIFKTQ